MKKTAIAAIMAAALLQGCCNVSSSPANAAPDKMSAPAARDVKIKGAIGDKMGAFIAERVASDFAKNEIFAEAERAFSERVDDANGVVGMWRGEFWGKLAISAARVQDYTQDPDLKDFLRQSAHRVMATQDADGYIGSYKDKLFLKVADPEKSRAAMGWPCDWCWNLWCRKYTLWGMLAVYENCGDPLILESARRSADQYIGMLRGNKIRICDTGTFVGMPSMSILKPMLILYRLTGDKKYLDFSAEIVSYWDRSDGAAPNFIANARTGKPVHEWYPLPHRWAKAYEMMSCLQGMLEYYRITGDKRCLETVEKMHALIWKHERNPIDGVGYNDQFANAANEINGITETCDSIHWMRLSHELFLITGEAKYMDIFETTALNAFLAGVYRDGKWAARGVRSHTRHMTAPGQKALFNHCCVNNVPRGFMDIAQSVASSSGGAVCVNLYIPASVKIGGAEIEIGEGYLLAGETNVKISVKSETKIRFRIPSWSPALVVNGKSFTGEWAEATANGEALFSLKFDNAPRIVHSRLKPADYPQNSNSARRWKDSYKPLPSYADLRKTPAATIRVGPLLLARSAKIGNTRAEMFGGESINWKRASVRLLPGVPDGVMCEWIAEIKTPEGSVRTPVCDFSSAADEISDAEPHLHSIFF